LSLKESEKLGKNMIL